MSPTGDPHNAGFGGCWCGINHSIADWQIGYNAALGADAEAIRREARARALDDVRAVVEGLHSEEWRECDGNCHDASLAAVLAAIERLRVTS